MNDGCEMILALVWIVTFSNRDVQPGGKQGNGNPAGQKYPRRPLCNHGRALFSVAL
jgi:hypothetical protein